MTINDLSARRATNQPPTPWKRGSWAWFEPYLQYISSEAVTFSETPEKQEKQLRFEKDFFFLVCFLTYSSAPFLTKHLIPQCCVVILTLRLFNTDLNTLTPFPRKNICLNSWKMHVEYKTGITLRRQVNEFDLQRTNSSRNHSCFQFSPLGILFIHLCSPTPCFFAQNEVDLHNERGSNLMYGGRRVP